MTRDDRQQISVDKVIAANGRGTIEACTGFGKTRVATKLIKYLRRTKTERTVHVVVPNEYLKRQWEQILAETNLYENSSVHIINSYVKSKKYCDFLIIDEIHRVAADTFKAIFEICTSKFILGLTPLLKRMDKKHYVISRYCPIVDRVTLEEAKFHGWVAQYQEFNLGIELDPITAEKYRIAEERYNTEMETFQWDFPLMKRCSVSYKPTVAKDGGIKASACYDLAREYGWKGNTPLEAYRKLQAREKNIWGGDPTYPHKPEILYIKAINGMRAMRTMKQIISSYPGKMDAAQSILKEFPNHKAITFADFTSTADEMAKRVENSSAYHSSMVVIGENGKKLPKKKARDLVVENLNSGKIRALHTAKALDEGADFPEISLGIRISGTSSPVQQTQRRGRIIRLSKNKEAIMVNIYLKDTKEVTWLSRSQGFGEDIFWVDSIEEIVENTKSVVKEYVKEYPMTPEECIKPPES